MERNWGIETKRRPADRWVSFLPCKTTVSLRSPRSREQDLPSGSYPEGSDTQEDPRARFFGLNSLKTTASSGSILQEDPRARFFEDYRNEAEEYDREFMKKYDEDLNTTLIFVSFL